MQVPKRPYSPLRQRKKLDLELERQFMAASILLFAILAAIVILYFRINPLNHSKWFIARRFINWFPLGNDVRVYTWGVTT